MRDEAEILEAAHLTQLVLAHMPRIRRATIENNNLYLGGAGGQSKAVAVVVHATKNGLQPNGAPRQQTNIIGIDHGLCREETHLPESSCTNQACGACR